MDNIDFVPFSLPSIGQEEKTAVLKVLDSGWLTTGKVTLEFENQFAQKIGVKHALSVNSATNGMLLALEACGVKKGTKILTTPYTFISTATPALHLGARIEYCDIEKDSFSIDPEKIEEKLKQDKDIKVVIPVHIGGNPCNMEKICEIAKKYNVYVIEDCAHAFPSKTENGYCGSLGDIGIFSFYATKTITTAEGGMITTNNDELAKRMKTMRLHGIDREVWDRYTSKKASWQYDVVDAGFKCNLPDILSAIGLEQLKKCDSFYKKRIKIAQKYNQAFKNCPFLILPPSNIGNSWHLYPLGLELSKLKIGRDDFVEILMKKGLGISVHFIPHYKFSIWQNRKDFEMTQTQKDFPNCENHFQRTFSIPIWPDMTGEMVQKVIDIIIETGKEYEI